MHRPYSPRIDGDETNPDWSMVLGGAVRDAFDRPRPDGWNEGLYLDWRPDGTALAVRRGDPIGTIEPGTHPGWVPTPEEPGDDFYPITFTQAQDAAGYLVDWADGNKEGWDAY